MFANTSLQKGTNNTRTNFIQTFTLDGSVVPGSTTTTYVRGNEDTNEGMTSHGMIVSAGAGQVLNVEVVMEAGGSVGTIQGNETAISIVKLPPTAKYIEVTDTTNQLVTAAAEAIVSFNTLSSPANSTLTHAGGSAVTAVDAGDYLFLSSLTTESDTASENNLRVIPQHGWQIGGAGGAIDRGQGGQYNRDSGGNRVSGSWNATLLELTAGQTVEMAVANLGTEELVAFPNVPTMQGLSIASLEVSNDPAISVNLILDVLPLGSATITDAFLDTFDADTPPTGLTYTVDSAPTGGDLKLSGGVLGIGGTFTQDDVDNGLVTFDGGATATVGGFDFTVSDGTATDSSSFVVNVAFPTTVVSLSDDGDVVEGSVADVFADATVAPVGAPLTVNFSYSGSATDGTDFNGIASVDIPAGDTNGTININSLADGLFEGAETVTVTIDSLSGATVTPVIGSPSTTTFQILDGANSAPTGTNLTQVVAGAGNVAINDILVIDPDKTSTSTVTTAGTPVYQYNGLTDLAIYADGRPDSTGALDLDATGPPLNAGAGFSVQIKFIPQAADLTGSVLVWEIGGTSNGSHILLINGVPHVLSKAGGSPANVPTDDTTVPGAFNDLNWAGDNTVVVPLNGGNALAAGLPACLAVTFDITGGTVQSSVNGSAVSVNTLLNQDNNNFRGDHSVRHGVRNGGIGGATNTGGTFDDVTMGALAGGVGAISETIFWNESSGTIAATAGSGDQITATLTIDGWVAGAGDLTATSGNGESYAAGVWTVTGDTATVSAALAAVEFVTDVGTADPTTIEVELEDGDEDGGGATTGTILVVAVAPDPIYVDDDFSGSLGDPIADADGGPPVSPATFGLSAFTNLADALGAVTPTGTIIVNDGDYSAEDITIGDMVTLQLTDTAGPVQVGNLGAGQTNSIVLSGSNTLEVGALNLSAPGVNSEISGTGNITKVGTGVFVVRQVNTYTGTTTVLDGMFRVGQNNGLALQSELAGDGPVVVTDPGRFELNVDVDKTINQTGQITGTGSVGTLGDGTAVFDGPLANTFSGGFELGDGATSNFDGVDQGNKNGFVVVNQTGHLGTGLIRSRGSQLQAGTPGVVVPNDINVDAGGFRCGGTVPFELGGTIAPINNALRGYGNYGLEGCDITVSGTISMTAATHQVQFEGSNNKDNGSWLVTGNITGISNLIVQNSFDNGVVTLAGTNDYTGTTTIQTGTTAVLEGTHTGGGAYTVQANATLEGSGSTASAVTVAGTLSPGGDAVGTLTTGDLTVNGTLAVDLEGGGSDQVVANGTATLGAASALSLSAGAGLTPGEIVLIANDAADPVTGTFAGLVEGAAVDPATLGWDGNITYAGGDGNDVAIDFDNYTIIGGWRVDNYGDPANAGPGENNALGSNGLANLMNFALGFDSDGTGDTGTLTISGGSITSLGQPTIWEDPADGKFYFQYTRRTDAAAAGLTIAEDFSRAMAVWDPSSTVVPAVTATMVGSGTGDDGVAIEAMQIELPGTLPTTGGKARFGRLNVSIAP